MFRVIYIVVLKLEAAASAQSIRNRQLMVLKVGIIHFSSLHLSVTLCWNLFLPI